MKNKFHPHFPKLPLSKGHIPFFNSKLSDCFYRNIIIFSQINQIEPGLELDIYRILTQ